MASLIETRIKTRYCESDALGHINSVSYYIYIEQARVDFLKESGIVTDVKKFWPFVLVSSKCDHLNQLYIDEDIKINTSVSHIGNSSFTLDHQILRRADNQLIAKGNSICTYFDFDEQKSKKLSDDMINKLSLYKN